MNLSREEQETIIIFNEADKTAEVYTHNGKLKKRLNSLLDEREEVSKIASDSFGFETFVIPKTWIRINPTRQLSEEHKAQRREILKKVRESKNT